MGIILFVLGVLFGGWATVAIYERLAARISTRIERRRKRRLAFILLTEAEDELARRQQVIEIQQKVIHLMDHDLRRT